MNCPFCNADLRNEGPWGFLAAHQSGEVIGHTYRCPNHEGFTDEESAEEYLRVSEQTLEGLGLSSWEELTCESSMHSVSGSFYTDKREELHNGYPC